MKFNKYSFSLDSPFPIRTLRENSSDIDLILDLKNQVLNLQVHGTYLASSKIQFPQVKFLLFRLAKSPDNTLCTLHIMRTVDLASPLASLVFDYKEIDFVLKKEDGQVFLNYTKK